MTSPEHRVPPWAWKLGVQEADGNFFENFTALTWKQENKRLRSVTDDVGGKVDAPPPSESTAGFRPSIHRLNKKEFEMLYIEVLYTIKHKIGVTQKGSKHSPYVEDLYAYARQAFDIRLDDHERLLLAASSVKPPILVLNVIVVSAKDLEAKDANGLSDPFCMLGICPGSAVHAAQNADSGSPLDGKVEEQTEKRKGFTGRITGSIRKSLRRDRTPDRSAREQVPAKYIQVTEVQRETLNPIWNEKLRFDIEDVNSDRLHLDIWDHDDESSVVEAAKKLNQVANIRGMGRYFKQIVQSARRSGNVDDFLGCINVFLKDIPSVGVDKWLNLEGRSGRSNIRGQIHLKLMLATREDRGVSEEDNWTDCRQHEDLICIFIEHENIKLKEETYRWKGDLPRAAETILHQHAIQGDVTDVQQAVCRWQAFSKKHLEHPFDYAFLHKILEHLEQTWTPDSLSRDELDSLKESFQTFLDHCFDLLKKQRELFPINNNAAIHKLEYLLKCLSLIYNMRVFKRCSPFHKELQSILQHTCRVASQSWYQQQSVQCKPAMRSDEDTVQSLVALTNVVTADCQKALVFYNKLYENICNFNYFSTCYKQMEKLLSQDLTSMLEDLRVASPAELKESSSKTEINPLAMNMGTQMFELYMTLQEFVKLGVDNLPDSELKHLAIISYHEWFKGAVSKWLSIAKHKAKLRIRKAVELDKVQTLDNLVKHSTSSVDTTCCFGQIKEFWKQLAWPDLVDSFVLVMQVMDDIAHGATFYAEIIQEKLKSNGYYDDDGQFDVTEELCISINNMEQVRKSVKVLPDQLNTNSIIAAMEKQHGKDSAQQCKTTLCDIVKDADSDLVAKILQVTEKLADRMKGDFKKHVFHLAWAPESVPVDSAITPLMDYLDKALVKFNNSLMRANFDRMLVAIWSACLMEIRLIVEANVNKTQPFFERMYNALGTLVDFFHASGKGLPMEIINSTNHQDFKRMLKMHKMDTGTLVDRYFLGKLDFQSKYEKKDYGTLSVHAHYNTSAEMLCIEVLNAKDLIPLDSNGLSDPYVLVEMVPNTVFANCEVKKTKIIKNNLNPVFEESFEFSVTSQQCKHRSSMVQFTVMDHDFMFQNDFAGEAYLSVNAVPGLNGEKVATFSTLKQLNLVLTHPDACKDSQKDSSGPLYALENRVSWDREAEEFCKAQNRRVS